MFDFDAVEEQFSRRSDDPAARKLPEIPDSPWIGRYRRNPSARIRLYAVLGVGVPAESYTEWVSEANCAKYPGIEVVVLELPGHGNNPGPPHYDPEKCANAIASAIEKLQFHEQQMGDRKRPFALYGFSLGSRLMWDAARRIMGQSNETCKKLYISCRGPPHIWAVGVKPNDITMGRPDFSHMQLKDVYENTLSFFRGSIDDKHAEKYARWLKVKMDNDPDSLYQFAETTACDALMGCQGFTGRENKELPLKVGCPILFYHSDGDETWPLAREDAHETSNYSDLPGSWAKYASSPEKFSSKMFKDFTHGMMGSPETPAFEHMMEDLSNMIAKDIL